MQTLRAALAACAGFLLGVLWMDLMFDLQALPQPDEVPEPILVSIAAYYHRVTTDAQPMGVLIASVMLVAVAGALWQAMRTRTGRDWLALALVALPVGLALGRVVPDAVRLGMRTDPLAIQSTLAHAIGHDHLVCLGSVLAFLVLQIVPRRTA